MDFHNHKKQLYKKKYKQENDIQKLNNFLSSQKLFITVDILLAHHSISANIQIKNICRMIQHIKINQYNIPHWKNEGKNLHDHFNWCRKALDKIHHLFMIKTCNKLGIEGNCLNIIKVYIRKVNSQQPTASSSTQQWWGSENFSSKIRGRMPTSATSIQYGTGRPSLSN